MRSLPTLLAISLTFTGCRGQDADLPEPYRSVEVPSARLRSPEARARGHELFERNCALCHGRRGDGHGLRSAGLARPPTDFTNPNWRRRTTPRHVFFAIREGLRGTPMPSWKWLGEDAAWDLVAFVLSLRAPSGRAGEAAPAGPAGESRGRERWEDLPAVTRLGWFMRIKRNGSSGGWPAAAATEHP